MRSHSHPITHSTFSRFSRLQNGGILRYAVVAAILAMTLWGCGSSSPTSPTTAAAPTVEPCTQTSLLGGAFAFPPNTADFETITTTTTGRVDLTLDWTLSSTPMALFVFRGACSFDQFKANACTYLLQLSGPPKPLKGSVPNLAPGTYGVIIGNPSSAQESVSIRVVLSSASCPAASSAMSQSTREPSLGISNGQTGMLGR